MATFESRAGDNNTAIETQLTRRDGTLQPLSGSEAVSFVFSDWTGTDVLTKTGSISNLSSSKVAYTPIAGDTSTRKGQVLRGRVLVTFGGGAIETFPTAPDDLVWVIY